MKLLSKTTLASLLFLTACTSSSKIKTYTNPSFTRDAIKSIALLPIRNISLTPSEGLEINRMFYKEVTARNPSKRIVDPVQTVKLLNDGNLVSLYDQFLREFENTGVPNNNLLKQLGAQLQSDALIQGVVVNFSQNDARYGGNAAKTSATLRYVIISIATGDILWESSCEASKSSTTTLGKTPPLFEVLEKAQKQIITSVPKL
jgi:hypothetical protein